MKQRQTYTETSKNLMRETHNAKHPKRRKTAVKATRKLGTIAGRLVRELERGLKDRMTDELREVRFIFITLCLQYGKDYYLCKTKDNIWKPRRNC